MFHFCLNLFSTSSSWQDKYNIFSWWDGIWMPVNEIYWLDSMLQWDLGIEIQAFGWKEQVGPYAIAALGKLEGFLGPLSWGGSMNPLLCFGDTPPPPPPHPLSGVFGSLAKLSGLLLLYISIGWKSWEALSALIFVILKRMIGLQICDMLSSDFINIT